MFQSEKGITKKYVEQECIPVGCVPAAAVAVRGVSTRHPHQSRPPPPQEQAALPPTGAGTPQTNHPLGPGTPL